MTTHVATAAARGATREPVSKLRRAGTRDSGIVCPFSTYMGQKRAEGKAEKERQAAHGGYAIPKASAEGASRCLPNSFSAARDSGEFSWPRSCGRGGVYTWLPFRAEWGKARYTRGISIRVKPRETPFSWSARSRPCGGAHNGDGSI